MYESDAVSKGFEFDGVAVRELESESGDGELGDDGAFEEWFSVGFGEALNFDSGESLDAESGDWVIGGGIILFNLECEEHGFGRLVEDEVGWGGKWDSPACGA